MGICLLTHLWLWVIFLLIDFKILEYVLKHVYNLILWLVFTCKPFAKNFHHIFILYNPLISMIIRWTNSQFYIETNHPWYQRGHNFYRNPSMFFINKKYVLVPRSSRLEQLQHSPRQGHINGQSHGSLMW